MRRAARGSLLAAALLLAVVARVEAQAATPVILSPEPGERVTADQVLVAVTLPGGAADSLALRVGARDVTAEVQLSDGVLTWRPREPLPPGPQRVVLSRSGAGPLAWTFNVAPAAQAVAAPTAAAPARARSAAVPRGTLVMEAAGNGVSGPGAGAAREQDVLPQLWLTAGGELRPRWRYSARAYVSGYESATQQPVNRFRADLTTPWLGLALGDVNPLLQGVILDGQRVRGGQLGLRAGPARLDLVAGRTFRGIPGALVPGDPSAVLRGATWAQNLVAVHPSLGAGDRFRVGLTLLHVRDDDGSVPLRRTAPSPTDSSTLSLNPAPRDNLVGGMDVSLRLASGRFTARYENAASLLTRDITERPATRAALDSVFASLGAHRLGIDPRRWDSFLILNASLVPLDPRKLTNVAHQLRTTLRAGPHTLSAEWRSVGTDYYSLGLPGLQRDWRGWRVRDSFTLPGDALFVTAGYGQDHDNLDGSLLATTTSRDAFATLTWQAPREVVLTGSLRLGSRGNGLAPASNGALDESDRAFSLAAQVPVALFPGLRTRASLNGSWVQRSDPANPLGDTRDLYYLVGLQGETPDRSADGSLLLGQNHSDFPGLPDGNTTFDRAVLALRRQLSERWSARFDGNLITARSAASATSVAPRYTRSEAMGGGEFAWRPDAVVTLSAGLVSYADRRNPALNTHEVVARLRLSRAF